MQKYFAPQYLKDIILSFYLCAFFPIEEQNFPLEPLFFQLICDSTCFSQNYKADSNDILNIINEEHVYLRVIGIK